MLAAAGTVLIYRGATGHCAKYEAAGVDTARTDTRRALSGSRFGILNSDIMDRLKRNDEAGAERRLKEIIES